MTIIPSEFDVASVDQRHALDVVLVMMPFGPSRMPSLGLSVLAQVLRDADMSVRVEYPLVDFVRAMGERDFDVIGNGYGKLSLGEWIFSRLVDPVGSDEDFIALSEKSLRPQQVPDLRRLVEKAVPIAAELVENTAQRIARQAPRVVGLSSSFQQQMSSVALATRLRELMPDVKIVMGGANCSSPMGEAMFKAYPVLDGVLVGPGEVSFPRLVRALLNGETDMNIRGLYWRDGSSVTEGDPGVAPEPKMDDLPFPHYDDFFEVWPLDHEVQPMIPFEGSRGCWWGQKQHCVFCSLNHSITYRAKNPERLYTEIVDLTKRFPGHQLFATDDILDHRIIGEITDKLAALPVRPKLFFQVKSNFKKEQLKALAEAGVNAVLPGIESLADEVLTLMRKGVTGLRNIQMMKWSQEVGIQVHWSILYGFPFDREDYYQRMTSWIPNLTHLPAPRGVNDVRIQRYSPLYSQAEHFGVANLRPRPVYALIHKVAPDLLAQLAYNFDWDPPEDQTRYITPLRAGVQTWMRAEKEKSDMLVFAKVDGGLVVVDTRAVATRSLHYLNLIEREICLACDGVMKRHQIAAELEQSGFHLDADVLDAHLDNLVKERLLMAHDDFFLFLALPESASGAGTSETVQRLLTEAEKQSSIATVAV